MVLAGQLQVACVERAVALQHGEQLEHGEHARGLLVGLLGHRGLGLRPIDQLGREPCLLVRGERTVPLKLGREVTAGVALAHAEVGA